MMELAGEIGDGVLLNYLVGPDVQPEAMEPLERAPAAPAGRLEQIDRPQLVVCSLDDDRAVALDRARELVTQYLGQQPHIMKASGRRVSTPGRDQRASSRGPRPQSKSEKP